jgi:hypothetical protein
MMAVHQHARPASTTWSASPRRSKPGAGDTPVSPARALQRRVPDRATLKTTSGAMVTSNRSAFFACIAVVWLCLSCRAIKT